MKYKSLPFWLLFAYIGYIIYKSPSISDALVVMVIAGLHGYELYLDNKKIAPERNAEIVKLELKLQKETLEMQILAAQQTAEMKNAKLSNISGDNFKF